VLLYQPHRYARTLSVAALVVFHPPSPSAATGYRRSWPRPHHVPGGAVSIKQAGQCGRSAGPRWPKSASLAPVPDAHPTALAGRLSSLKPRDLEAFQTL
jgi:hypothetical protein